VTQCDLHKVKNALIKPVLRHAVHHLQSCYWLMLKIRITRLA